MTRRNFMFNAAVLGVLLMTGSSVAAYGAESRAAGMGMDVWRGSGRSFHIMGPMVLVFDEASRDFTIYSNGKAFFKRETVDNKIKYILNDGKQQTLPDGSVEASYKDVRVVCDKPNKGMDVYLSRPNDKTGTNLRTMHVIMNLGEARE